MSFDSSYTVVPITEESDLEKQSLGKTVFNICSREVTTKYAKKVLKNDNALAFKVVDKSTKKTVGIVIYLVEFNRKDFGKDVLTKIDSLKLVEQADDLKPADALEIAVLCVDPKHRGKKLAEKMIEYVLKTSTQKYVVVNQSGQHKKGSANAASKLFYRLFSKSFFATIVDEVEKTQEDATFYVDERENVLNAISGKPSAASKKPASSSKKPASSSKKPAAAGKKPAAAKKPSTGRKRKASSICSVPNVKARDSFTTYTRKVLKQTAPETKISRDASCAIESLVQSAFGRIADRAGHLAKGVGRSTLQARDIQMATKLELSGELAKHGVSELAKAVSAFSSSKSGSKNSPKTASQRSGLVYPPGRVLRLLKERRVAARISADAGVALAAVLEYLVAELTELSSVVTKNLKSKTIALRHLMLAVRSDSELGKFFKGTFAHSGAVPSIHKSLVPHKKAKKESQQY